jgi:hypothetical protein
MKIAIKIFFTLILTGILCASCNKVSDPYKDVTPSNANNDSVIKLRKLLIEDYTGHTCGNCPRAADTIEYLKAKYSGQIISMAVHAGGYADPVGSPYSYDFRTSVGNEYDNFFGMSAINPNAMINRIGYPSGQLALGADYNIWLQMTDTLVVKPISVFITIENTFNSSTKKLDTKIYSEFLDEALPADSFRLVVLVTEDSIVKPQTDYRMPIGSQDVLNYVHHFILRGAINGTWGETIAVASEFPITSGTKKPKIYSYTITASDWNPKQCYVLAYVYNATTYEVIQAEEKKFIP